MTSLVNGFLNEEVKAEQLNVLPTERHFEINSSMLKNLLTH